MGLPTPHLIEALSASERTRIIERAADDDTSVDDGVRTIIGDVRRRGDQALLALTERYDGVRPARLLLGPDDFQAARARMDNRLRNALERAAKNLRVVADRTHTAGPHDVQVERGLVVREHHVPLARVGCYVPGGKAAYPSSVLMAAVPAKAAGVPSVVVASPPGSDGRPPDAVLAACAVADVDELVVAGGAQAIAALAYGTETIRPVDKIVGPGNRFVTAAKRLVFGRVGIDSPAGPTEVLILADETADPAWVGRDLVAQAEHGEDSRCILVTTSLGLARAVAALLPEMVQAIERADIVHRALEEHGHILVAKTRDEACTLARDYAPEHMQVMTKDPEAWADAVPTAATTFIGPWAPVPVGDYLTGANHVLPTGGAARWAAPLSVHDFLVRRTRQFLDATAARALIDDLEVFARAERLPAHAEAFAARRKDPRPMQEER